MNVIFNINSLIAAIFLFHRGFAADQQCQEGSPGNPGYEGNRVILAGPTIMKLEKSSFICEACEFIATLSLTGRKIEQIEDGAFENLRCLNNLDLSSNEVLEIHPKTFAELKRLKMLNFTTNNLKDLKNMTFAKNYQLKKLDLTSNNIQYIENRAFYNLTSLEWLLLSKNEIKFINFEMFRNLPKLKMLYLDFNKLTSIDLPKKPFPNIIEFFDVSNNELIEGVENIYLPKVKKIILTQNKIKKLDVQALKKNSPKLEYIELLHNKWKSRDLPAMELSLQKAKIRYGELSADDATLTYVTPTSTAIIAVFLILVTISTIYLVCGDRDRRRGFKVHPRQNQIELQNLNQQQPLI